MRLQPDTWVGQLAPSQFGRTFSASKEIRGVFSNQKKRKKYGVSQLKICLCGLVLFIILHCAFFFFFFLCSSSSDQDNF